MSDGDREEVDGGVTTRPEGREERSFRPPPDPPTDRPLIFFLALGLVLGLAAGTQYVAWRFAFHRNLGAPLVVLSIRAARWLRAAGVLAAGGALASVETTVLMTVEETLEALAKGKGIGYRRPGQ